MADLSGLGPKRFYKHVDVKKHGEFHGITVDGKFVKTPKRNILATPSHAYAVTIAAEWDAQEGRIRPSSMPMMGLASAALDVVPEFRERMLDSIKRFTHTDTACIRADRPSELVAAQDKALDPIIAHATGGSTARIEVTRGGLTAHQETRTEQWVSSTVHGLDDWSLVAMDSAASCAKSVLIAIALRDGVISPAEAVEAARSEELWQSRVWGVVEGGHDLDDADAAVRMSAANAVFRFAEMDKDAFRLPLARNH